VTFHSALYRGELAHARDDEQARRAFRYGVYMAALDLDELDALDATLHLFSRDRPNLFGFRDRDYATATSPSTATASRDLRGEFAALRAANGLPAPAASRLVTNLRAFGYLFNPVSFCIDYDVAGEITSVIAEVNNTYGGNLRYVLGPRDRIAGAHATFRHFRELYVSPFLHGDTTYDFTFDAPLDGSSLDIRMNVYAGSPAALGGRRLFARFAGHRSPLSDRTLALAALRYPFMTAQVIGLIHWQAIKLRFAGVPFLRPGADHRPVGAPARTP
jgi:uncharacterized protein